MSRSICAAFVFSCVMLPAGAQAAPQILALVETDKPTVLDCADGICAAEFSAFCLQENRPAPAAGTVYAAIGDADIRLVLTLPDGAVRERPAADLEIVSVRGYSALRLSVPQEILTDNGATTVAVSVGERVALAPQVSPGDPYPITREELAMASGPLRTAGQAIVDRGGKSADTARITNALVNAMPADRTLDPGQRQSLWQRVAGIVQGEKASPGQAQALWAYEACWNIVENAGGNGLRGCLQRYHDIVMQGLTTKYWEVHKAGS